MSNYQFIDLIKNTLATNLPGEEAHLPLLPLGRRTGLQEINQNSNARKSAVAVNLFYDQTWKSVLIQRPIYRGHHSGQICLPGGSIEPQDKELLFTAIRECEEETGVKPDERDLLGQLTPVYIPVSNFLVVPYVFHLSSPPIFVPDQREVEEILVFDLEKELKGLDVKYTDIDISANRKMKKVPYFAIKNKIVWGATALILSEMKEVLKNIDHI